MNFNIKKLPIQYIILTLFGALMIFMGIMNHYYFRTFVFDYGNYNYAYWDYSHFRISPMPTYPGNFLQDHFSFLLMFLLPVHWLFNWLTGSYTLILIQSVFIILAAWYSYKIILQKTQSIWLGTGVLIYYFLLLGRYTTFSSDVNLAVMSACLIPIFLYYFEARKYGVASVILILSLLSRENIPVWFVFIFIVLIIQHRKDRKAILFSLIGISISILYFVLLFSVLIPGVEDEAKQYTLFNYSALGEGPGDALLNILKHPIDTLKLFVINHLGDPRYDGIKTEFYLVYLISGGIVLFLRPQYLIWFIPVVAQKVLNDAPIRWGILTYYSIEVVTLLPVSVFLTISSLKSTRFKKILTVTICISALAMTIYKMVPSNQVEKGRVREEKIKFYSKKFYQSQYHLKDAHRLLKTIPPTARVSASEQLFPHLSQREYIRQFPTVGDADYIVYSVFDDLYLISHEENEMERNKYLESREWEIIGDAFPVFLLKKRLTGSERPQILQDVIYSDTLYYDYELSNAQDNELVGGSADRLFSKNSHSGQNSIILDQDQRFGQPIRFNDVSKIIYITCSVWYYGNDGEAFIVTKSGDGFYIQSNYIDERDNNGWKKLILNFWAPQKSDNSKLQIYLWNSSRMNSILFDDLQIVRIMKAPQSMESN